ncbi:hypothetical protein [Actinomadura sp. SCN-SB]|uniref:hypothetical protein n=1 Tax=Actinomadura sp. SCN-SB TaxID=3373092 RepID=UPI00375105C3
MTTMAQLRKAALALPEVEEGTHFGMAAFSVRGKGFVSVTKDGDVQLQLPEAEIEAAESAHPTGERILRGDKAIGFRVPLADVNGKDLSALVRAAWFCRAPKKLAAELSLDPPGDCCSGCGNDKRDAPWPAMMGLSRVQQRRNNEASGKCNPLMSVRRWLPRSTSRT